MSRRMRWLAPLGGAVIAALGVAAVAGAYADGDGDGTNRAYAFAGGTTGPGCVETDPPFCHAFGHTYRILAVPRGERGRPWGVFERRNQGTGGIFSGRLACSNVNGNRAVVGGYVTASATPEFVGEPFLIYLEDNGPLGSASPDRISPLGILPPGDPLWALVPDQFPERCPSADGGAPGSFPLATGDVTVADRD
jgi:hypothetical protein